MIANLITGPLLFNFVYNHDLNIGGGEYSFGFKVQNILNEGYEATQTLGDSQIIVDDYDIGTTFAASLKRRF